LQLGVEGGAALGVPLCAHGEKRVPAHGNTDAVGLGGDHEVLGGRENYFSARKASCEEVVELIFGLEPGFCNCLLGLGSDGNVGPEGTSPGRGDEGEDDEPTIQAIAAADRDPYLSQASMSSAAGTGCHGGWPARTSDSSISSSYKLLLIWVARSPKS
jgi:hypothetical protein